MVQTKHAKKLGKAYSRSREKAFMQDLVEDAFYDSEIPNSEVGGGDPGLAQLMQLHDYDVAFSRTSNDSVGVSLGDLMRDLRMA